MGVFSKTYTYWGTQILAQVAYDDVLNYHYVVLSTDVMGRVETLEIEFPTRESAFAYFNQYDKEKAVRFVESFLTQLN